MATVWPLLRGCLTEKKRKLSTNRTKKEDAMPEKIHPGSSQLVALLPDADADVLAETLTAFANADGGTLYVGVDEEGAPTGAVFPEEFNEIVPQAELRCRPPIPVNWEQVEAGGAFVFVGRVQRSVELHTLDDGRVLA